MPRKSKPVDIDPTSLTDEELAFHVKNIRRMVLDSLNGNLIGPRDLRPKPYIPGLLNEAARRSNLGRQFK